MISLDTCLSQIENRQDMDVRAFEFCFQALSLTRCFPRPPQYFICFVVQQGYFQRPARLPYRPEEYRERVWRLQVTRCKGHPELYVRGAFRLRHGPVYMPHRDTSKHRDTSNHLPHPSDHKCVAVGTALGRDMTVDVNSPCIEATLAYFEGDHGGAPCQSQARAIFSGGGAGREIDETSRL